MTWTFDSELVLYSISQTVPSWLDRIFANVNLNYIFSCICNMLEGHCTSDSQKIYWSPLYYSILPAISYKIPVSICLLMLRRAENFDRLQKLDVSLHCVFLNCIVFCCVQSFTRVTCITITPNHPPPHQCLRICGWIWWGMWRAWLRTSETRLQQRINHQRSRCTCPSLDLG